MAVYDEEKKLWQSTTRPFDDDTEFSPGQRILNAISKHGSKLAQINDETGVQLTYDEIRLNAIRAAQNLLKRGFKPRDVFGFLVDHSDRLVSIMVAAMCLACPMAALHPALSKEEIVRFFKKAKPTIVFCDVTELDQLDEALQELPFSVKVFTFGGKIDSYEPVESLFVETGGEDHFECEMIDRETDVGVITCSSGSTGPAKCMSLHYGGTLFTIRYFHPYDSSDVVYFSDNIFWAIAIKHVLDCIETGALRIILPINSSNEYRPETPLQLIENHKVTILPIATFDLIACLKTDYIRSANLSSVREIYVYGGHMPTDSINEVAKYFPNAKITVWYGMTEIGLISFNNPIVSKDSGGTFAGGYTIKVVDDNGERCGPNVCGELCLKKEDIFRGYLDDHTASVCALDAEGFFQTGDIVCIDEDGRIFIKDRKKNILTLFYYDNTLLPFELEECLIKMRGIKEVCVVGIPIVGSAVLPAAVIVPKHNVTLNKRDVFDMIADHFPERSWLRAGVYFVDSLPKTSTGKLVRREITKMAIEMFEATKQSDPEIHTYLLDLPSEFRKLIC